MFGDSTFMLKKFLSGYSVSIMDLTETMHVPFSSCEERAWLSFEDV